MQSITGTAIFRSAVPRIQIWMIAIAIANISRNRSSKMWLRNLGNLVVSRCMSYRSHSSLARFAAASSHNPCPRSAAVEAASAVAKSLDGAPPSLVLLFANAAHYGVEVGQLASVSAGPSAMTFQPCAMPMCSCEFVTPSPNSHAVDKGGAERRLRGETRAHWMCAEGEKGRLISLCLSVWLKR